MASLMGSDTAVQFTTSASFHDAASRIPTSPIRTRPRGASSAAAGGVVLPQLPSASAPPSRAPLSSAASRHRSSAASRHRSSAASRHRSSAAPPRTSVSAAAVVRASALKGSRHGGGSAAAAAAPRRAVRTAASTHAGAHRRDGGRRSAGSVRRRPGSKASVAPSAATTFGRTAVSAVSSRPPDVPRSLADVEDIRRRQAEEMMDILRREDEKEQMRLRALNSEPLPSRRRMLEVKFTRERRKAQERVKAVKTDHELALVTHMTRLGLLR